MSGIDRRSVLTGLGATAALTIGMPIRPAYAAHRMTLGAFEITVVSDGTLTLPMSFVLPDNDRREVAAVLEANGAGPELAPAQVNVTCVKTPAGVVLIDAGGGTDFIPGLGRHAEAMEAVGIAAEDITHVVFTHAHPDHLWGIIDPFEGGSRFPKARHVMPAAELDHWLKPDAEKSVPETMQGVAAGTIRRLKTLGDLIEPGKAGAEIVPGLSLVDTAGHTPGHVSVMLSSGSERMLVGGDALTHPILSFAKPDWRWGADMDSARAIATRKRLLDQLATDRIPLLGYHLPWPGVGRVEKNGTAWRYVAG